MRRNILADRSDVEAASIDRIIGAMTRTFAEAAVSGCEHLIDTINNDAKDRHVAALAVHRTATAIVTYNVRDFRGSALPNVGVEIVTPPKLVEQLVRRRAPRRSASC